MDHRLAEHTSERETLANNLLDAEIYRDERRAELHARVVEYRGAKRMVRIARARLDRFDFLQNVAATFGPEIASVVDKYDARV